MAIVNFKFKPDVEISFNWFFLSRPIKVKAKVLHTKRLNQSLMYKIEYVYDGKSTKNRTTFFKKDLVRLYLNKSIKQF